MKFFIGILILTVPLSVFAGDKIGNGGGLWACMGPAQNITSASLVDLYEAQNEFGLDLVISLQTNPMGIVAERAQAMKVMLPDYFTKWQTYMNEVTSKMRQVNSELVIIDDALFRIKPLPSTCVGTWQYTQFANFTDLGQLLIRQDLWNSPIVGPMDKAALIWHEVIYRWLRVEYHVTDSVMAREIVGVIFSQLSASEMKDRIDDLVVNGPSGQPPAPADPPITPGQLWICMIENIESVHFYGGYGMGLEAAKASAEMFCGDDMYSAKCNKFGIMCEQITSQISTNDVCAYEEPPIPGKDNTFTSYGRSQLEAEFLARKACFISSGDSYCDHPVACQAK